MEREQGEEENWSQDTPGDATGDKSEDMSEDTSGGAQDEIGAASVEETSEESFPASDPPSF